MQFRMETQWENVVLGQFLPGQADAWIFRISEGQKPAFGSGHKNIGDWRNEFK